MIEYCHQSILGEGGGGGARRNQRCLFIIGASAIYYYYYLYLYLMYNSFFFFLCVSIEQWEKSFPIECWVGGHQSWTYTRLLTRESATINQKNVNGNSSRSA